MNRTQVNSEHSIWFTEDQKKALSEIDVLMTSEVNCFLLKGYAGTGKTFLTKHIAKRLSSQGFAVVLMAPTGRAARVLQEKTGFEAATIHKTIYTEEELSEPDTGQSDLVKFKFKYGLKNIASNNRIVYLVDESSMISDKRSETDFLEFGSGRLLKDILDFIALTNRTRKNKVLFIGDHAQLPPVSDRISGALDSDYLITQHNVRSTEWELKEVVRQGEESGILKNAMMIRDYLKAPKSERIGFALQQGDDVIQCETDQVAGKYFALNPSQDLDGCVLINHSNKNAFDLNQAIRSQYYETTDDTHVGDLVMIYQNSYNHEIPLYNGTMAKIHSVSSDVEVKPRMKSYDENGNDCYVSHRFRWVTFLVDGYDIPISSMILESFLFDQKPSLDYAENIALYLDFKFRNQGLKVGSKEFRDALKADPYFNALKVKFGYAITCHKAQGGEWENVLINMDVSMGKTSNDYLRWVYTAVTRARKKLYYFNFRANNSLSKLQYQGLLIDEPTNDVSLKRVIEFEINEEVNGTIRRFGLQNGPEFLRQHLISLLATMSDAGIDIVSRKGIQYGEVYTFSQNEKRASLLFSYNGKERFTRTSKQKIPGGDSTYADKVLEVWESAPELRLKGVQSNEETGKVPLHSNVPRPVGWTSELFDALQAVLEREAIFVEHIDHGQYHEKYHFTWRGERAVIVFSYNGQNQFTSARPDVNNCTSNELLGLLKSAVNEVSENNQ